MKRHQLYIDNEMTDRLEVIASKRGCSKSAILTAALREYLNRRGAKELDDLLAIRLGKITRDQQVILESLALFIRYQLTITAPVPDADQAALATGRERFQAFIDQVGRIIASGKGFGHDLALSAEGQPL